MWAVRNETQTGEPKMKAKTTMTCNGHTITRENVRGDLLYVARIESRGYRPGEMMTVAAHESLDIVEEYCRTHQPA